MTKGKKLRSGKRYRLLLYKQLFGSLRWPSLLLAIATYALWWLAIYIPLLARRDWLLWPVIGISALLFLASLIGPGFSFVQCRPRYLLVSTPLYRMAISYGRIENVQPANFGRLYPFAKQGWSQRRFLEPLFHNAPGGELTVVNVELKSFPISERWLRIWLNDYMFAVGNVGLLFMVQNWMALSHDIGIYRQAYRHARITRRRRRRPSVNPFARS